MKNYEEIISLIISKRKDLTREEIEKKIEEKIKESRFLNKLGAALILAEELNIFPDFNIENLEKETLTTRIIDLVSGLKNVAIIGRVLFITPLKKVGQHSYIFGKIGDKTGKINLILWNENALNVEKLNLKPGDIIKIEGGYVKQRFDRLELNIGKNGKIEKLEEDYEQPDVLYHILPLKEVIDKEGVFDIKCKIKYIEPLRSVNIKNEIVNVKEAIIVDNSYETKLVAWRDKVDIFNDIEINDEVILFEVRLKKSEVHTTKNTWIIKIDNKNKIEEEKEEKYDIVNNLKLRIIEIIDRGMNFKSILGYDGNKIVRIKCFLTKNLDINKDDIIVIKRGIKNIKGDREEIIIEKEKDYLILKKDIEDIPYYKIKEYNPDDIIKEEKDIIIYGFLKSKSPLTLVETKYGLVEKIYFWISGNEKIISGIAWHDNALKINQINIGEKIKFKWVNIKRRFKDFEIEVTSDSVIEIIK
ncbi:MAG: OB-fold nucleic acid binding domain-containing protein [Nitrososphaerota archaeon]